MTFQRAHSPNEKPQSTANYRDFLLSELRTRKDRNPLYSLRAFSRDLGIGSTTLSDVIAGKRHLSKRNVQKIAENLSLSPKLVERILREIQGKAVELDIHYEHLEIQEDVFRLISDWYYFAVLNLARIRNNRADPAWVAARLGISEIEARDALARLKRLGYLEEIKGRLKRTALPLRTTRDIPSSALRSHHRQNLHRAEKALDEIPVELREISSTTFAISQKQLPKAKEMIVQFRRKFSRAIETNDLDDVYTLAIQFFPATQKAFNKEDSDDTA